MKTSRYFRFFMLAALCFIFCIFLSGCAAQEPQARPVPPETSTEALPPETSVGALPPETSEGPFTPERNVESVPAGRNGGAVRARPPLTASRNGESSVSLEAPKYYPVWFGTNRQLGLEVSDQNLSLLPSDIEKLDAIFTGVYSDDITYGRCDVFIPESHVKGSTGSGF